MKTSLLALAGFQTTFGDFEHLKVQKVVLFDYVRNKAMLVLVSILFNNLLFFRKCWQHLFLEKVEFFNIPGHCYGSSKCGPYGPQGPWAQHLFDCVAVPSGFFFSGKTTSQKKRMRMY